MPAIQQAYNLADSWIAGNCIGSVSLGAVLMCLGLLFCPDILIWLSVPAEATVPTRQYLMFYIAGLPFLFLYNITTGVLNGLGDSKAPLVFLAFSSFLNIALDLALVLFIPLGISGLALATLISQAASSLATLLAVRKLCRQLKFCRQITPCRPPEGILERSPGDSALRHPLL